MLEKGFLKQFDDLCFLTSKNEVLMQIPFLQICPYKYLVYHLFHLLKLLFDVLNLLFLCLYFD